MTNICVVGLGKIGLAIAAHYASREHRVIGCDIDERLVELVNRGQVPAHAEDGLAERVRQGHAAGTLSATTCTSDAVARSETVVVIVPLVVDASGVPDFAALDAATASIAAGLQRGTLVIYETTLPLGTTRERFGPMLEVSGLHIGVDFHLAFSPERVLVGRSFEDLQRYPKIVGGVTREATERAAEFYASVLDAEILTMENADTAEFVKLAETTYRDVNIGLANELARFAQARGINAVSAFAAANTQPYSHLHQPGAGVGGHCIPVYPRFLLAQAAAGELDLVRRAREVNNGMAAYTVDVLAQRIGDLAGKKVLILGLAYRGGQKEASFSSALLLIDELRRRGCHVLLHDPLFSFDEIAAVGAEPVTLAEAVDVVGVILQTDHPEYQRLDWSLMRGCQLVVDGRNVLDPAAIFASGLEYVGIGRSPFVAP
jgi:nucleotide sugar dehydrogenase